MDPALQLPDVGCVLFGFVAQMDGIQDVVDNENVDYANLKLRRQFHDRLSLSRVRVFFVAWKTHAIDGVGYLKSP